MEIQCKKAESLPEFIDSIRLRVNVFIKEQDFAPGYEPDEDDRSAVHFITLAGGRVVSTARYRKLAPGEFKIERMATQKEFRGKGITQKLLKFMLEDIKAQSPKKIWLRAQEQVQGFYEKNGFAAKGKPFDMYGKMHMDMEYVGARK